MRFTIYKVTGYIFFFFFLSDYEPLNSENKLIERGFTKLQRGLACAADSLICAMASKSLFWRPAKVKPKMEGHEHEQRDKMLQKTGLNTNLREGKIN